MIFNKLIFLKKVGSTLQGTSLTNEADPLDHYFIFSVVLLHLCISVFQKRSKSVQWPIYRLKIKKPVSRFQKSVKKSSALVDNRY